MSLKINIQPTPDPNAMTFQCNINLFAEGISVQAGERIAHPLAKALLEVDGIDRIFGLNESITINKTPEADWETISRTVQQVMQRYYK